MAPETADLSVLFSRKERRLETDYSASADSTHSSHPGLTQRKGGTDTSVHQTGELTAVTVYFTNTPELPAWEKRSAQWAKGTRGERSLWRETRLKRPVLMTLIGFNALEGTIGGDICAFKKTAYLM